MASFSGCSGAKACLVLIGLSLCSWSYADILPGSTGGRFSPPEAKPGSQLERLNELEKRRDAKEAELVKAVERIERNAKILGMETGVLSRQTAAVEEFIRSANLCDEFKAERDNAKLVGNSRIYEIKSRSYSNCMQGVAEAQAAMDDIERYVDAFLRRLETIKYENVELDDKRRTLKSSIGVLQTQIDLWAHEVEQGRF